MKKNASTNVTFFARLLASLNELGIHMRLLLSSFGIGMALLAGSFEAGAADPNAIYDLPSGVTPYIIDDADVKTIGIKTPSQIKFLYAVDKDGHVKKGAKGKPFMALDWIDIPWAAIHYFPVPVSDSREGTNKVISAYNGSLLGSLPSSWDTSTYDHLLATRVDNLPFLGERYPYDFSSSIYVGALDSTFKGVKETGETQVYEALDLVLKNPFLTNRTNKVLHRDPFNTVYYQNDSDRPFTVAASSFSVRGPQKGHILKGRTKTGFGFDSVDGNLHTYWSSGNEETPTLVIDLKEVRDIEKIVIRWRGYYPHRYRLSLAGWWNSYKSIYRGRVNPNTDLDAQLSQGLGYDAENNELPTGNTVWEKGNSYFYVDPDTGKVSSDVNEVFHVKNGGTQTARYIEFEGLELGAAGKAYEIRELEVYAYDADRSQAQDPRLFTFNDKAYLLYDNTSNGKIDNDPEEGGDGRRQYMVQIKPTMTSETKNLHRLETYGHTADMDTLVRLNRPVISAAKADKLGLSRSPSFVEKNLTPFEGQGAQAGKLLMVYGYDPLEVYEVDVASGDMTPFSALSANSRAMWGNYQLGAIQGGTPAVFDSTLGGYVTFFQSSTKEEIVEKVGDQEVKAYQETSFMGALVFQWDSKSKGYRIQQITPVPLVHPSWYQEYNQENKKGVFPLGLAQDDDNYYVSLGVGDTGSDVATFSRTNLYAQLVSVGKVKGKKAYSQRMDFYLLIGSANMAGRAPMEEKDEMLLATNVFLYNSVGKFKSAYNPLNRYSSVRKTDHGQQQLGPGGSFATTLSTVLANTYVSNRQFGLVVNCREGGSIESWLPEAYDTDGWDHPVNGSNKVGRYEASIARVTNAMNSGTLKGILMTTGEANALPDRSFVFMSDLKTVIESYRKDLGMPNLPFLIAELCDVGEYVTACYNGGGGADDLIVAHQIGIEGEVTVVEKTYSDYPYDPNLEGCNLGAAFTFWKEDFNQQLQTLEDATSTNYVPYTAVVRSDELTDADTQDGTHFDHASVQTLGERFAEKAIELVYAAEIIGPDDVPGKSKHTYTLTPAPGVSLSNVTWSVDSSVATIVGATNQMAAMIEYSNKNAAMVTVKADFEVNGKSMSSELDVALVQVGLTMPIDIYTPGRTPATFTKGLWVSQVNPGGAYVTEHDPGSEWKAFTYSGTTKAAEISVLLESAALNGDPAYYFTVVVTLTAPSAKPEAVRSIQAGFIQKCRISGNATYGSSGKTVGTRTLTLATTNTLDWMTAVSDPGSTKEWPWYDKAARWTPTKNSDTSKKLVIVDSPSMAVPSMFDTATPGPNSNAALKTASVVEVFDFMLAARTLDTFGDAHKSYFEVFKMSWEVNYVWPYVPNAKIVTAFQDITVPPSAREIDVNVVPSVIGLSAPFGTWVPSSP